MWKDRLVWAANRNGKYSVKSGYRWLQVRSIDVRDHRMPVVRSIPKTLWKCICQLDMPPKIRHFLWVSLHLGLPTGKALFTRRLSSSPSCPLCQSADETVEHVFLRCPWVAAVWFGGALNYKVDVVGIDSWARWLQAVFSSNWGSSADRQWFQAYVSFSCWFIWKARCDFVFNQVPINPSKVIFSLSTAFGNFLLAVSSLGIARPVSVSREEVAVSWEAFPILARAKRLGSAFQNCRWSWVPRSANLAANVLASADITEMCDFVWVDKPPSSLVHASSVNQVTKEGLPQLPFGKQHKVCFP
ncbi:unnamed protein product [Malus baccata var. baccata]